MSLTLRPASMADARRLFDWRNDPVTRAMAITTDPVPWDGHVRWLTATLDRADRQLLIGEGPQGPVGTVRFDMGDDIVVSITLAPDQRGRGLALPLLTAAIARLSPPANLLAQVKPDNPASRRLFERAGFDETGTEAGLLTYRRRLD